MPIDGPLMAIDQPHGTAMAIDELRWDLSTGTLKTVLQNGIATTHIRRQLKSIQKSDNSYQAISHIN